MATSQRNTKRSISTIEKYERLLLAERKVLRVMTRKNPTLAEKG